MPHVSLEAENLIPEVEMEVATNLLEATVFTLTDAFNTIYPTAAKPVKSAILTGQTLVNVFQDMDYVWNNLTKQDNFNYNGDLIILNNGYNDGRYWNDVPKIPNTKSNTEYTMIFTKGSSPRIEFGTVDENGQTGFLKRFNNAQKVKITSPNNGDVRVKFCVENPKSTDSSINLGKVMFIEGDYTNIDIPYFEGMQSVKMPVLTTVGKNLFDMKYVGEELVSRHTGFVNNDDGSWTITAIKFHYDYKYKPINFKENTQYTLSATISSKTTNIGTVMGFLYTDGTFNYMSSNKNTLTSVINKTIECITFSYGVGGTVETWSNIQLEQGSQATSYEPHKSNILTVNEDIELRGIGDVKDESDCLTGEVTQLIGEVVLDGSDDEIYTISTHASQTLYTLYRVGHVRVKTVHEGATDDLLCDKLPSKSHGIYNKDELGVHNKLETLYMNLPNELTGASISGLRAYLQSNPITIQYLLAEPNIKTVDLTVVDQDGNATTLETFDDTTHVLLNSEGLIPTASLTVRTKIPSASSTSLLMDDISTKQEKLTTTIDEQSENVDATIIATTEIFEEPV